jgi:putative ABC transport system substrate-binding protein
MWCSAIGCIVMLILSLLVAPLATEAQQATTVYRIGRLSPGPPLPAPDRREEAFRQGLRDLGYVEGHNLVIVYRYAEGNAERLHELAAELARLQVDVLVAEGLAATLAAQHATHTLPIVMTGTPDPVGAGFVASLARPGGNITGLSFFGEDLPGKRLALLKETVPQSTRIAVVGNPAHPGYEPRLHHLAGVARALGLHLHVMEVRRVDELDPAFAAMTQAGADALLVLEEPQVIDHLRRRIADLAVAHRLPTMYSWRISVAAGGLMSYGLNFPDIFRRAATYVDKILQGTKPADLPVERPTKFELVLNLKTAEALGLTIPPSILLQADEVIK